MPKISSYPDGGAIQSADAFVVARAGANRKILGSQLGGVRTTFVPTLAGTTIAGAGTYTAQTGEYVRIGNVVFFNINLAWTAHTGTGNMKITGLPIAPVAGAINIPVTFFWRNIVLLAVGNKLVATLNAGATEIAIFEIGGADISAVPMDTNAELRVSGFYFAA
jgi:hypothetical protein